jgi:hypothetical protein
VDVLFAWLIGRLGPRAVNRTARLVAFVCAVATVAFVVVIILVLSR